MTMKTQTLVFPKFYPRMTVMGLRSAALRVAKELRYKMCWNFLFIKHKINKLWCIVGTLSSMFLNLTQLESEWVSLSSHQKVCKTYMYFNILSDL